MGDRQNMSAALSSHSLKEDLSKEITFNPSQFLLDDTFTICCILWSTDDDLEECRLQSDVLNRGVLACLTLVQAEYV